MDEMKVISGFTRGILSKLVMRLLKKKFDCDINVQLNEINVSVVDGKSHIYLDLDAELEKDELVKILKRAGLN